MNRRDTPFGSAMLRSGIRLQHSRRTMIASLAGGGLLVVAAGGGVRAMTAPHPRLRAAPALAQSEGTPEQFTSSVFTGKGFVGEAQDVPAGKAFVAVAVADTTPGADAREVRALLYGDTENEIREWFPGAVTGTTLDLASDGGARLRGEFSDDGASGTITMPDGMVFPFDAAPVTGVGGLYTVSFFVDGRVEGTSERGVQLVGRLGAKVEGTDIYPLSGTLNPPEGEPRTFALDIHIGAPLREEIIPARFVVLDDGRILGGAKRRENSSNFYDYISD